jgi:hypothetical protein
MTTKTKRFSIRFDGLSRTFFRFLRCPPSKSYVEIDGDRVRVRMAWSFGAEFALGAVKKVAVTRAQRVGHGLLFEHSGGGLLRPR